MTILQALDRYYGRMAAREDFVTPGWSVEPIGNVIVLSRKGKIVQVIPWLDPSGKKARTERVPKWFGRSGTGSTPFFLWDNTAYALGVSEKDPLKTARDFSSFRKLHLDSLSDEKDDAALALKNFLTDWDPSTFEVPASANKLLKQNVAFRLDGDDELLHRKAFAATLVERLRTSVDGSRRSDTTGEAFCLIRGTKLPIARLHRKIKGVNGTAAAEVPLVSFEGEASRSYGQLQGDNAPTSVEAVFRYSSALNALLDSNRESLNRLRRTVGDATVVFWAEADEEAAAEAAESIYAKWFDPTSDAEPETDQQAAAKLLDQLKKIEAGRPGDADPKLRPDTRFHILGLAPNAARLSVRYWIEDDFSHFAARLLEHARDLAIAPPPHGWGRKQPSVARLLVKTTALREDFKNIPDQLAGEVMRAILSGAPYPRTLLTTAVIRLRAGDEPWKGWHAAVIKACLNRPLERKRDDARRRGLDPSFLKQIEKEMLPVALDPDHDSSAYQLGRLFAVLESAQYAALGQVNAPIGDRYYGSASSTPARVFGALLRGLKTHVSDARKRGRGGWIEPRVTAILARLPPDLPRTLRVEDQGKFAVGYYHERSTRPAKGGEENQSGEGEQA